MAKFIFTFGLAYNLGHNYCVVEAPTSDEARQIFVAARAAAGELEASGHRWAFQYSEDEIDVDRFHLTEVPLDTPIRWLDPQNPIE